MNSKSLPQNKALFGSKQLANFFIFVLKCVPTIRALSSAMEGTILNRRWRKACWDQEPSSNLLEDGVSPPWRINFAMSQSRATSRPFLLPLSAVDQVCVENNSIKNVLEFFNGSFQFFIIIIDTSDRFTKRVYAKSILW